MQVKVKKYLFMGAQKDKEGFFEKAQEHGVVEFIDKNKCRGQEFPAEIKNIQDTLKILSAYPIIEQEEGRLIHLKDVVKDVLDLSHQMEALLEQRRFLKHEISRVEVFGDFSISDIHSLEKEGGRKVQFFFAKKGMEEFCENYDGIIYVGSNHGLDYFVSINPEAIQYDCMVEMAVEKSVVELRSERLNVISEIQKLDGKIRKSCKFQYKLKEYRIDRLDYYNLISAQDMVELDLDEKIFATEGWVADNSLDDLSDLAVKRNVYLEEISIEEDDKVPVYLDNNNSDKIGEDLVNIYDTPSVTDKDPSTWVLWSFAFFFSIIIGDGGYGLIFMIAALFLRWKFPDMKGLGKRMVKLTMILAMFCMLWGGLTASFFGIKLGPDSNIRKISVTSFLVEKKADYHLKADDDVFKKYLKQNPNIENSASGSEVIRRAVTYKNDKPVYQIMDEFNDNINMEIALLIGILHLMTSFLRYLKRNWAAFGWVVFMIGGYLYFPALLNATSMLHFVFDVDKVAAAEAGLQLVYGGIGSAVVLALLQKRMMGVMEISNVIQVFSDVLSYLRLYALGLASSMMSQTFNDISASVSIIPGILIIIIGHSVNITLSIMSGVIHGLRLNFLEWYHYSFEGGGKLLQPLKLLRKNK